MKTTMQITLDDATISLRDHIHKWPGLLVIEGEGKILVKMRKKLSIYVPKDWQGWPVEVIIEDWKSPI